jgi:nucleotide-binding universal stress UspA family protein
VEGSERLEPLPFLYHPIGKYKKSFFTHSTLEQMKKIKNILVPTDFSLTAKNAFQYAKMLAETLDATVTVVHINEYFIPVSDIAIAPLSETEESQIEEAMDTFVSEDIGEGVLVKSNVKTKILQGDPVERLLDLSESNHVDVIVMGSTGLQDFLSKIIGSTSLELANKAHCPVILVPRDTKWERIDRIMYASNYDSTTPKMIREVTEFAISLHAAIHFVHVEDFSPVGEGKVTEIIWDELFSLTDPSLAFEIHSIYGNDKIQELKQYAVSNDIDLMAFVSKHRSFWENLMHKSVTENIAVSAYTPMLIMHLDDDM